MRRAGVRRVAEAVGEVRLGGREQADRPAKRDEQREDERGDREHESRDPAREKHREGDAPERHSRQGVEQRSVRLRTGEGRQQRDGSDSIIPGPPSPAGWRDEQQIRPDGVDFLYGETTRGRR